MHANIVQCIFYSHQSNKISIFIHISLFQHIIGQLEEEKNTLPSYNFSAKEKKNNSTTVTILEQTPDSEGLG